MISSNFNPFVRYYRRVYIKILSDTITSILSIQAQYAYDLYWCQNTRNSDTGTSDELACFGDTIEFESFDEDLLVSNHWEQQLEYNERYDDEDDPNDENNWRNDYPDEDDIDSWNGNCSMVFLESVIV